MLRVVALVAFTASPFIIIGLVLWNEHRKLAKQRAEHEARLAEFHRPGPQ